MLSHSPQLLEIEPVPALRDRTCRSQSKVALSNHGYPRVGTVLCEGLNEQRHPWLGEAAVFNHNLIPNQRDYDNAILADSIFMSRGISSLVS
jgi:hypothetical protein